MSADSFSDISSISDSDDDIYKIRLSSLYTDDKSNGCVLSTSQPSGMETYGASHPLLALVGLGSDKSRWDEHQRDEPRRDEPGSDELGSDEHGSDTSVLSTSQPSGMETYGASHPLLALVGLGSDKSRWDEHQRDEPRRDEPGSDEPGSDELGSDEHGSDTSGETWDLSNEDVEIFGLVPENVFKLPVSDENLAVFHQALQNYPDLQKVGEDPIGLRVKLLPHQKQALKWMIWRETQCPSGGILADDMGLGKTLSMLALVLSQKNAESDNKDDYTPPTKKLKVPTGGTLVICPSSVLSQWEEEIKSKFYEGLLDWFVYHGTKRDKKAKRFSVYDVVLTTYSIMQRQQDDGPLLTPMWDRVILDEAHIIRNHKTQTAISVFKLKRKYSWALTGTPIHNKGMDYYSLLKFIDCRPFSDLQYWKGWMESNDASSSKRLNVLNKMILLRRTKAELNNVDSNLKMTSKTLTIVRIEMDPEENKIYENLAQLSRAVMANYIQQKAEKENFYNFDVSSQNVMKHLMSKKGQDNPFLSHPDLARLYANMLNKGDVIKPHEILMLILRLRQMCCHASLVVSILDKEEIAYEGIDKPTPLIDQLVTSSIIDNDSQDALSFDNPVFWKTRISSKVKSVVACIETIFNEGHDKIIVVSQWTSFLSIIENVLENRCLPSLSFTGKVPVKDRGAIVDSFNNDIKAPRILLLSLTAGGTGLNLMGGNHLLLADIHWNPQLEAQACDRIYRYGQTKNVHIYKFICSDTIEERIEQLQEQKLKIAKGILTGSMHVQTKLTLADFKHLFGVN